MSRAKRASNLRAKRGIGLSLGLASMAACALAGCSSSGRSAGGSSSGGSSSGASIGISVQRIDLPFNVVTLNSLQAGLKSARMSVLPPVNANLDPGKQITDISTLLTRGIKGLVIVPDDSDAIAPAVQAANAKKVPVVTADTAANGGKVYMNIRADNAKMGASACDAIGKALNGKGTVLELEGDLSTSSGVDRHNGFAGCMKQNYSNMTIVAKPTNWTATKATDAAQTVLSTRHIDAIFVASDEVMLSGVLATVKNLGQLKPAGSAGHIVIGTIDGGPGALDAIRAGSVDAAVSQPITLYGKYAAQYLADALAGKTQRLGPTDHNSTIVMYKGNMADMLNAPVVTKANVADPTLWANAAKG